ncbi:MAG: nicotinate-nucleotide adenylyltransferase [Spirochaetota bacterium]
MRIGVFGGTFDPVHWGHIRCARNVRDLFSLDLILFVPSKSPVHKQMRTVASADDRAQMIELALAGESAMELSRIEIDRDSPSYSVITAGEILQQYPGSDIFFVLGTDAFNDLRTWKQYRVLMGLTSFIVMRRKGDDIDRGLVGLSGRVSEADNELIDISSTQVRMMAHHGRLSADAVPEAVAEYICAKRLYSE